MKPKGKEGYRHDFVGHFSTGEWAIFELTKPLGSIALPKHPDSKPKLLLRDHLEEAVLAVGEPDIHRDTTSLFDNNE